MGVNKTDKSAKQHLRGWKAQKRRAMAVSLRAQGLKEAEIARRAGVCQQTVSKWLREEDERLAQLLEAGRQHLIQEQLAAIQKAQEFAFLGFRRSLRDAVEHVVVDGPDGQTMTTRRKGQSGNPAFLAQVVNASNRLAQMLGLDAPPQTPQPPADATPTTARVVTIVTKPEDAERLRDEHLIYVEAEAVQELEAPVDPGPPPAADGQAGEIPEPDKPRKGVRRRTRRRKD